MNETKPDERQQLGQDIAFGVQQTLACWATDAIDPPLSKFIQNRFGDQEHKVTNKHVWYGEILGDSAALFEFVALKKLFRSPIEKLTQGVEKAFDPIFDKIGRGHVAAWAEQHHLAQDDPKYLERVQSEKDFTAHAAVDSGIVATGATLSNVAVQKMAGNHQPFKIILLSKLAGASITMSLMLGLRTGLPRTTKHLDKELNDRYFDKVVRFFQKAAGVADAGAPDAKKKEKNQKDYEASSGATVAANAGLVTLGGALGHFVMDLEPVQQIIGEDHHWATKVGGLAATGAVASVAAHMLVPNSVSVLKKELDLRYLSGGRKASDKNWSELDFDDSDDTLSRA